MTFFDERPQVRWAVPAVAVGVIAAMSFLVSRPASADTGLPPRTAAQLLVDIQQAHSDGLSGTITQTADLGLPALPGVASSSPGSSSGDASLTSVLSGTHTWRVWVAGPTQQRLALLGSLGESDVVRNGADLWVWSSKDKTASHRVLTPPDAAGRPATASPTDLPKTPEEAAQRALAAIDPSTEVTTSGATVVAGRQAYELVLTPRDGASRVAQVRIAVDAEKKVPLRVQVYAAGVANPAVDVGFAAIDFTQPDAAMFAFTPPPGTTVTESGRPGAKPDGTAPPAVQDHPASKVVGTGWTAVVVTAAPAGGLPASGATQQKQLSGVLNALPKVSGTWGSGRLVDGTLFSAVLTDDGRLAVGAVAPEQLYAALAAS